MLGRKQSIKGEPVLADYGPEESFNESADIEWVNKVKQSIVITRLHQRALMYPSRIQYVVVTTTIVSDYSNFCILEMGSSRDETMCPSKLDFCQLQHPQNVRKVPANAIHNFYFRYYCHVLVYGRNDSQNAHTWNIEGKQRLVLSAFIRQ